MYKRRTKEDLFELNNSFMNNKYYLRLYEPLKWVEIQYEELSPEEVWDEVMGEIGRVATMARPELQIPLEIEMLRKRYSAFYLPDGTIVERAPEHTSLTTFLVIFGIVYRLLPLKEKYSTIINLLLRAICNNQMFIPFKERVAECENRELDQNNFITNADIELSEEELKPRGLKSELYTDIKPDSWFITKHDSKDISHQKLKDFIDRNFLKYYRNKYEWVALYLFCKNKHLEYGRGDAKSFIVEMNKSFWYPNESKLNYGGSIQPYLYLEKSMDEGYIRWVPSEKVSFDSIKTLKERYEWLNQHFSFSLIYK